MAHSTRTLRIAAASLLAVLMVGGTYLSTGPNPFFGMTRIVGAQSSEELLREYAAKDSDTDGLPDWQEALYGTDPLNPESFQAGIKDGEAVAQGLIEPKVVVRPENEPTDPDSIPGTVALPNSLTDRFARKFFSQYLLNRGENPPSQQEVATFVQDGIADLVAGAEPEVFFSTADVKISSDVTGGAALTAYAARAETALASENIRPAKNELFYFSDAVKGQDSAITRIQEISDAYTASAKALMATSVPQEASRAHLAIGNALMNMGSVTKDMSTLREDPLRALMGIGSYERRANELVAALAGMHGVLAARGVAIPAGTTGAEFLLVAQEARDTAAEKR